ncbi:YbfB/YjiJ family MFS transporter [Deinococcus yavapaiensis]|uniref:Putative MFS family arabinose efflux permease n=1 Tax=Deinococcus yavapaiensis KR-236 TaxID=694435 RepID=A0A318S4T3_9DEIO|nr:YbfB/YjiJ family MFS transporter [Deinococcus yavapaiensis]PYE52703.1 putative MFS family arabinose efflux permease [Deinococcus yavapaiensis KR-236]
MPDGSPPSARDERAALADVLRLALGVVVALGFARFAYALLLPAMRSDLGWSYTTAGSLNTANAAGYLLGAVLAAPFMTRFGAKWTFLAGMLVTGVALLATGLGEALPWLLFTRGLAGASGALTFTAGGVLAAHAASSVRASRSGTILSVFYAGGGLGILATGLVLPSVLDAFGAASWHVGWLGLGGLALLAVPISAKGIAGEATKRPRAGERRGSPEFSFLRPALIAYTLFAVGYIAYMTFSVALLRARGADDLQVTAFWSVLGLASMIAPWIWGGLLQRARGGTALAVLLTGCALGAGLPVLLASPLLSLVSAALFGASFLSVVAATTALVRHHLPTSSWSAGVATFTVVFAAFQTLGPLLSGWLSDRAGGLPLGLGVSAALLLIGAVVARLQPPPPFLPNSG